MNYTDDTIGRLLSAMPSNKFFLVPQITADEKYFDVSRAEILRAVLTPAGKFDRSEEHQTRDEYGVDYRVVIRLNVNCQSVFPEGWTIALKLHNERIDGFDWEAKFVTRGGGTGRGWHRHQWDQSKQSAKEWKIPAPDLNGADSREQFIIRALKMMRINLNARDYGDQLSLSESDSAGLSSQQH